MLMLVCTLFCLIATNAFAQGPTVQVYGGYSLLHPNLPTVFKYIESELGNVSGWNTGVTVGINKHVGVTADVSGYYKNYEEHYLEFRESYSAKGRAYTFLFGPQFTMQAGRLNPFARTLFGLAYASGKTVGYPGHDKEESRSVFAASIGGGLDVVVTNSISIRAAQLDYYPFRSSEGGGLTFNNFRYSAGVVFNIK